MLRLDEELREIREQLQLSPMRDTFELHDRVAVRVTDISQVLLGLEPRIVHFSGHGQPDGSLCVEDRTGRTETISPAGLAALFGLVADHVECVVLNACYSETLGRAVGEHVDYVIGMRQAIGDRAAIAFATGFYQALAANRSVEKAYEFGRTQIQLRRIPEHLEPLLFGKKCART